MILILGGTTEGKKAMQLLNDLGRPYLYSTKTEINSSEIEGEYRFGALGKEEMIQLIQERNITQIIDAAHPFAQELHQTVAGVGLACNIHVYRVEREYPVRTNHPSVIYCEGYDDVLSKLEKHQNKVLLALSGVQSIPKLEMFWKENLTYFRILDRQWSVDYALKHDFPEEQLILGLPNKDLETEVKLYQEKNIGIVLTKESGESGSLSVKVNACLEVGIPILIIEKPELPESIQVLSDWELLVKNVIPSPEDSGAGISKVLSKIPKGDSQVKPENDGEVSKENDGETSLKKVPNGPLKEGFTTGTSATASAKAGLLAMVTQKELEQVSVQLPVDKVLEIPVHNCEFGTDWAKCSVLKDAGDDPDVTNGAEVGCEIQLITEKTIAFEAGEGVGTVTLPGLELGVGEPAINPVPRKMITDALNKVLHDYDLECGVLVKVFVTDGKKLAKKTLNERVGIMNGLSILGTTGIVIPYSASSYIASITQGIDVAIANGITELVINSGARSEKYLKSLFPEAKEQAFVHYGNWIGETLQKIKETEVEHVTIGIMLGKAVKLARGNTDTHSCVSTWDKPFIATIAESCGYNQEIQDKILELNMAGRLPELFEFKEGEIFYQELLKACYLQVLNAVGDKTTIAIYLISKTGEFIKYENNSLASSRK